MNCFVPRAATLLLNGSDVVVRNIPEPPVGVTLWRNWLVALGQANPVGVSVHVNPLPVALAPRAMKFTATLPVFSAVKVTEPASGASDDLDVWKGTVP